MPDSDALFINSITANCFVIGSVFVLGNIPSSAFSLMYYHSKVTCILSKHGCRILVTFAKHIFNLTYTFLKCSRSTIYSQRVMSVTQPENAQYGLFRNLTGDVYFSPGMFHDRIIYDA